jgi:hypothetical protein
MPRPSNNKQTPLVYSRTEQRAIVIEALRIFPNVWQVYQRLGKLIGVSYGAIWSIARDEGIELIRCPPGNKTRALRK